MKLCNINSHIDKLYRHILSKSSRFNLCEEVMQQYEAEDENLLKTGNSTKAKSTSKGNPIPKRYIVTLVRNLFAKMCLEVLKKDYK